jgi:hypothetical protein
MWVCPQNKRGITVMNEEQRIKVLEEELKVLKNELKTVLLDLREQYLNIQNPFNYSMSANAGSPQPGINPEKEQPKNNVKREEPEETIDEIEEEDNSPNFEIDEPVMDIDTGAFSPDDTSQNNSLDDRFASAGLQFAELDNSAMSGPSMSETIPESKPAPANHAAQTSTLDNNNSLEDDDSDDESELDIVEYKPAPAKKNNKKKAIDLPTGNTKFDLVVIAGLTQWIDQATAKLGRERTEALVEMSCTMGRTPENLKEVLIKMARLSPHESNGQPLKASDYLSILAQLENLLGDSEIKDHALLSILSMMKESNDG